MVHRWIACSLEAFEQASGDISAALSSTPKSFWGTVDRLFAIATYARILVHRGEVLHATELLGLVFNHPNGPQGYLVMKDDGPRRHGWQSGAQYIRISGSRRSFPSQHYHTRMQVHHRRQVEPALVGGTLDISHKSS
jgi:hypothetical protein